jgi:serine protease
VKRNVVLLIALIILTLLHSACGSGGGDPSSGVSILPGGSVSGQLNVPPNNHLEAEPNDAVAQAQAVTLSSVVAGRASELDSGFQLPSGNQVQDLYRLTATESIRIVLTMAQNDHMTNDLDLFLLDGNGIVMQVSQARNTGTELLDTSTGGTFLIGVRAFTGTSVYTLSFTALSSLPSDAGVAIFPPGVDIVPDDVVVQRKAAPINGLQSSSAFASKYKLTHSVGKPAEVELLKLDRSEDSREDLSQKENGHRRSKMQKERHPTSDGNTLRSRTYDAIRRLRLDPDVEFAHANYRIKPRLIPNDGYYSNQWHYQLIALEAAWDVTAGSDTIIAAVIDTGVVNHPDLQARLVPGYDFISDPLVAGDGDGRDPDPTDAGDEEFGPGQHSFHGTHVAGTIGAATNNGIGVAGVTWHTKIMPLRVLGKGGGTSFDLMEALKYAAGLPNVSGTLPPQRAHVINLSLGACAQNPTERATIDTIRSLGIILVAAAGNNRTGEPGCPAGSLEFPASYNGVISVSAVDILQNPTRYSSFGSMIDAAAPGGDISSGTDVNRDGQPDGVLSTWRSSLNGQNGYAFASGTSMSAAHVTGVVSLMFAVNPELTPDDVDLLLAGTHPRTSRRITTDLGAPGRDNDTGYGLINAAQAVLAAREITGRSISSTPVFTVSTTQLNFDTALDVLTISAGNAGGGILFINSVTVDVPWLTVTPTSGLAPLSLRARVDRGGLAPGAYSGRITIASNANQNPAATVDVTVKVGPTGEGNVGPVFAMVISPQSFHTIAQAQTSAEQGYTFVMPELSPGVFLVVAGTDRDNDHLICEEGDACGIYPDLVTVLPGQRTPAIDFTVTNFVTSPSDLQVALTELSRMSFMQDVSEQPFTDGQLRLRRLP